MLIQSISPRRSTRRPIIILCAIIFVIFFTSHLDTPLETTEIQHNEAGHAARRAPSLSSRIHSLIRNHTDKRIGRLSLPHVRGQKDVLVMNDAEEEIEEHHYRGDGLLEVNPAGPHPIYELVRTAQQKWNSKLSAASQTLEEAVLEYQRRYKRLPPKGFDNWWAYVKEKNVQLPDEYDQIYRDLEPFWGMDPNDLQTLQRNWELHADSFTIGKDSYEDQFAMKNFSVPNNDISREGLTKGAYEMIELMEEVADKLPPFRAVFSPHDNPNLPTDYELKEQALEAARSGTFIDITDPPEAKLDGWVSACPPDSPARNQDINWGGAPPPSPKHLKTFIYNHRMSMDACQHPAHFLLHGQFISHRRGPIPHRFMVPQFSYGPTQLHHDITPAMPINWVSNTRSRAADPPWAARADARVQWRGSNTGIWHASNTRWDLAQRARLVRWGGDGEQALGVQREMEVLMPAEEGKRVGRPVRVHKALWAPAMVDVAFAGEQINCAPEMCKKLGEIFEFRKRQDEVTAGKYKYYIDVDGNGWSSRFKRLITSNALVFKSTIYPEWYTDRVAPWVHYVPIQVDLSDLWDALVFFRGDPSGNGAHDEMAQKIAEGGREWSKTFWRKEDMVAYNFRLFLEYSRVMSPDRSSLSFDPKIPGSWSTKTEEASKNDEWR